MKLLLLIIAACAVITPIQGSNKLCFDQSYSKPRRGKQTVRVIPQMLPGININFKSVLKNNLADVSGGDCGDNKKIKNHVWLVNHTHHKCMKVKSNSPGGYKYFDVKFDEMIKPLIESHVPTSNLAFLAGTCSSPDGAVTLKVIPHY